MRASVRIVLALFLLMLPATIFWIWLLIQAIQVLNMCPSGCWCDPGGKKFDCRNVSLRSIPTRFPRGLNTLDLGDNNFTQLREDAFIVEGLEHLEVLSLDECELIAVEPGVFTVLNMLIQLSLMGNYLKELKPGTLTNLTRLEQIYLANNNIETLDPDMFAGLDNLQYLLLSGNSIKELNPDVFINTPKLEILVLNKNYELKIPTNQSFLNIPKLKSLYISDCNVSIVIGKSFENTSELRTLDLSKNSIKDISTSIFRSLPKLSSLFLYENPLECDCHLQQMWLWCYNKNITTTDRGEVPTCNSPSNVSGLWWGVMQQSQCIDGDIFYYGDYKNLVYEDTDIDFEFEEYRHFIKYGQSIAYSILFLFGATGNVTLIIIILCNQTLQTMANMYILNLAFSDLLTLILNLLANHAHTLLFTWDYGQFMCEMYMFLRRMSVGSAAYSVAVLSIHRYHVTARPFDNRVHRAEAKRFTLFSLLSVWLFSSLFALPSAFSMHSDLYCTMHDSVTYYKKVVIFEVLVTCVLPIVVIVFMYVMTARILVHNARPLSTQTANPQANVHKKIAKIVLGLAFVFVISFVPYHIMWAYILWYDAEQLKLSLWYIYFVSSCLLVLNSCFNPVAVYVSSTAFRLLFKRYLLCRYSRKNVQQISFFKKQECNNDTTYSTEETKI